ncbi:l-ascorbate oxidase-like protein [Hordeum vulgare]|nr:l-ascorbate oxidase-like protein [Hordeum vulgare]
MPKLQGPQPAAAPSTMAGEARLCEDIVRETECDSSVSAFFWAWRSLRRDGAGVRRRVARRSAGPSPSPRSFARAMEAATLPVLWLRAQGSSHDAMKARVQYPKRQSMLLGRGWKAFARAHSLEDGHTLCFKLTEDDMLSIKFYGNSGVRLGCCEESSSGSDSLSSSGGDEERSDGSDSGDGF